MKAAKVANFDGRQADAYNFKINLLDNKGENLEILWFVTLEALAEWNRRNGVIDTYDIANFSAAYDINAKMHSFTEILKGFIDKFNGYPSSTIKTKKAVCVFCYSRGAIGQEITLSDDLSFFYLFMDVVGVATHKLPPGYLVKHELYHGIARAKEKEHHVANLMKKYSSREEHILGENFHVINRAIKDLEGAVQKGGATWRGVLSALKALQRKDKELHYLCSHQFGAAKLLLNMIADSMLTILAMESEDDAYIRGAVEGDEHNFTILESYMKHLSRARNVMASQKIKAGGLMAAKYEKYEAAIEIIELLLFWRYLPIKSLPLLAVGEKFRDGRANKYFKGSDYMRAKNLQEKYLAESQKAGEADFIKWLVQSYMACLEYKLPDPKSPFKELHSDTEKYEILALHFKERLLSHLKVLDEAARAVPS